MLMHVRALTGSFALAGLTVGVDLAASAIVAPVLGRIIDRRGPRAVMLVTGIVCPLALVCILLADRLALSAAGLVAAAAIAGAFAPPITVLTRTVWRYRFDDPDERRTAFALDAVLIELAFTLGPMLVAALLAVASPRVAFAAALHPGRACRAGVRALPGAQVLAPPTRRRAAPARAAGRAAPARRLCGDVPADVCARLAGDRLCRLRDCGRDAGVRRRPDRDQFARQRRGRPALRRRAARRCRSSGSCRDCCCWWCCRWRRMR